MTDLFNEKAQDWDADDMKQRLSAAIGASIIKHVPLKQDMYVMDFGAGTGLVSSHVAPLVNKIVAVDISQSMLDRLVAKPELQGKVEACCQDIMDQPLDTRFDLIISAMALHHVDDTQKILTRFAEHLKPGAQLALADLDKEDGSFHPEGTEGVFHTGFEREALQALLEKSGFHDVRFYTAHTISNEKQDYPVFLVVATKH